MSLFALTEEETQLAETARAFLSGFVDNTYLNEQEASEDGYEAARWKQLTELGWTGVHLPERVGGSDATLVEAALIARECGRAAYASPLLQTLRAGTVLLTLTDGTEFDEVLARLAEGEAAAVVAPPDRTVVARGGVLAGPPTLVTWLRQSGNAVVVVPEADDDTWTCAVLATDTLLDRTVDVPSMDNERTARLDLDGIALGDAAICLRGIPAATARYALARGDLIVTSAMVGGCEEVLRRSAAYALERHQFGQPIGGFQAVRHHLARMAIAADGARLLCDDALTRATADAEETAIAAAARFAAGRAYVEIVLTAAQVHGGVGTTVEHVLHHHFRRAKAMQLRNGRTANRLRELHELLVVRHEGSLW